jgi:hypothetical protein
MSIEDNASKSGTPEWANIKAEFKDEEKDDALPDLPITKEEPTAPKSIPTAPKVVPAPPVGIPGAPAVASIPIPGVQIPMLTPPVETVKPAPTPSPSRPGGKVEVLVDIPVPAYASVPKEQIEVDPVKQVKDREVELPVIQEYKTVNISAPAFDPSVNNAPSIKQNKSKVASKSSTSSFTSRFSAKNNSKANIKYRGGRGQVLLVRGAVWTLLVILTLGGLKGILFPSGPSVTSLTNSVASALKINSYPKDSAQSLATRFTQLYLNYDPSTSDMRSAKLMAFLAGSPTDVTTVPWVNNSGSISQKLIEGPYLIKPVQIDDPTRGSYSFKAKVLTGGATHDVYLLVTVAIDSNGFPAIAGPPAFLAPINEVGNSNGSYGLKDDPIADKDLAAQLPRFFKAWAASDSVGISVYLSPKNDATPGVTNGMGGIFTFSSMPSVRVEPAPTGSKADLTAKRGAEVQVTWNMNGILWTQSYRLYLETIGGKWYVADIFPGDFGG